MTFWQTIFLHLFRHLLKISPAFEIHYPPFSHSFKLVVLCQRAHSTCTRGNGVEVDDLLQPNACRRCGCGLCLGNVVVGRTEVVAKLSCICARAKLLEFDPVLWPILINFSHNADNGIFGGGAEIIRFWNLEAFAKNVCLKYVFLF